jgi:AcrR family transcriptional regulator
MADGVKPRRRYDSRGRQQQARRTQQAVLEAARRMFLDVGYPATTVAAIAAEAGVSVETVYKAFGNKPGLLKAVFDVSIVGDDERIPMLQRDLVQQIGAEPDPRRKLAMYGEHLTRDFPRSVPIELVVRAAAASDPAVAQVWDQMLAERLTGMTAFARHLHTGGHLRHGVSIGDARDVLWTYTSTELYDLLVNYRGWSPRKYGRWVADALIAALLPPVPTKPSPRSRSRR